MHQLRPHAYPLGTTRLSGSPALLSPPSPRQCIQPNASTDILHFKLKLMAVSSSSLLKLDPMIYIVFNLLFIIMILPRF